MGFLQSPGPSDLAEQKHASARYSSVPFLYSLILHKPSPQEAQWTPCINGKLHFVVLFLRQWLLCARLALNSLCG